MLKRSLGHRIKQWVKQERPVSIATAGVTGAVIILRLMGVLQLSEFAALDQLFRLRPPEPLDDRIVIVEINETNLQQVGQWPIPDGVMAQLLRKLNAYHPRAIGLDIYRDLPVQPGHEEFVSTAKRIPNLIGIERIQDSSSLGVAPPPVLSERQQVGFNNVVVDADGKIRRSLLYWHVDGKAHTSLGLQLALIYLQAEGITAQSSTVNSDYLQLDQTVFRSFQPWDGGYVQADANGYQILVNFPRPSSFRTVSIADVLANRVPAEWLRDRIVLIGSRAPSLEDVFYTPYSSGQIGTAKPIFGVELQASFISQILSAVLDERPLIKVWGQPLEWLWIGAWSAIGAAVIWQVRSPLRAFVGILGAAIGLGGICYLAFLGGWWLPLVPPALGLVGAATVSISHIAHLQEELKRSKEFFQTVINTIPDPVFVKDKDHHCIILNEAYCQFVGYPLETLMEKSDYDIFPQEQADNFWTHDELILQTGEAQESEAELTDAFGTTHLIATKKSLHRDGAGNLFLVGVIRDITERKRAEEELRRSNIELKLSEDRLRYLAYHDPLTGLANRKQFHERLSQSLDWARSSNELLALMFLDLDGFKQVNDTLGHDIGDELLKVVAQRLTNNLRTSDIVSRLGGDEFTVILPGIPEAQYVGKVAQKIAESISQVFVLDGHDVYVTASIGISIYPVDGEAEEILIKNADTAMYRAKQLGRNQHQFCHTIG
ncbi:MAG TPA: diguanylate cyclase [Cyanobacteria bacterium UBA8803]|nr:diguanylate cyclase [Cyanobacteria bacterium UBA9273]HBL57339.1 diguanylate cyclase [Cyanobacteria bacterium UBA8803]